MRSLCYVQRKSYYSKIVQSKLQVITPKGYLLILLYFNFWRRSVNYRSVVCSFINWLYLWNRTFLRYRFYIISDPLEKFFSGIIFFQMFSRWVFADRQSNDVSIWCPGVTSDIPPLCSEFHNQQTLVTATGFEPTTTLFINENSTI